MLAAGLYDIGQGQDQEGHQKNDCRKADELRTVVLLIGLVEHELVADTQHAVGQYDAVDGIAGGGFVFQGIEGFLPATGFLEDRYDGVLSLVAQFLFGHLDGLVGLSLIGQIVHFEAAAVNGVQPLLLTFLKGLVALEEPAEVATVIVAECLTCLDVEHTVRGVFLGSDQGHRQQTVSLSEVIVVGHVDDVHVDRGHVGIVALLCHAAKGIAPVLLGFCLITAVVVDVSKHVHGHVHLGVDLFLA